MNLLFALLCAGAAIFMLRFLAALLKDREESVAAADKSLFREVQSSEATWRSDNHEFQELCAQVGSGNWQAGGLHFCSRAGIDATASWPTNTE
jgi:hypothetical protein